jgi:hypothetical protein
MELQAGELEKIEQEMKQELLELPISEEMIRQYSLLRKQPWPLSANALVAIALKEKEPDFTAAERELFAAIL